MRQDFVLIRGFGEVHDREPLARAAPTPLQGVPRPGMVEEDPPHRLRRGRVKMGRALEGHPSVLPDAKEGLVHEGGRLEGVPRVLLGHAALGDGAQLVIHGREQLGAVPISETRRARPGFLRHAGSIPDGPPGFVAHGSYSDTPTDRPDWMPTLAPVVRTNS